MLYAVVVALVAYRLRFLTFAGAIAAAIVGGVIWEAGGLQMAVPLLVFFISSSLFGKLPGGSEKDGPRTAGQVLANGAAATLAAALIWLEVRLAPTMFLAALCAANADTWATEIGMRYGRKPIRITTLKPVEPGVSGAISTAGVTASLAGAAFVAIAGGWIVGANLIAAAAAGVTGSLVDSILGDTVQAKFWTSAGHGESGGTLIKGVRWIRNNEVNFAMTAFAAAAAYLFAG